MKYLIVKAASTADLMTLVNAKLADNWELWGDPFTFNDSVMQAMVRKDTAADATDFHNGG